MKEPSQAGDRMLGQILGERYEVLERIGEGAMGVVYKARHIKVGRTFAVKLLHAHLLDDPKTEVRFDREAELAGRLRHANVVGVVDVGDIDGMRYMVMDLAEGPDLAELLVEAPMQPARIIHLVRQILEGLYHAHEQGLIHRDLKPENVIVERDAHGAEMPRIVDFGIAILREGGGVDGLGRLTTDGLVLGTPHYMAPEQAVADPIDHRIDLFALGIVIYEMLSGHLPFDGSGAEIARANLLLDPPRIADRVKYLEVDPLLEAFARRLMAKQPSARPPTAKAARELLDLIERDRPAAGAALGLSSVASLRTPAATQPVPPHERGVPLVWPAAPPTTRLRAPSPGDLPAMGPPSLPPPPAAMPSASSGLAARAASPIVLSVVPSEASPPLLLAGPIPPTMALLRPAQTAGLHTPTSVLPTLASIPPTPASVQRTVEMLAIPAMPSEAPPIAHVAAAPAMLEGPRAPLIELHTAVRAPLDWPPAPPVAARRARRTGVPWFAAAAGLGAVSLAAALIAPHLRRAPHTATAPIDRTALPFGSAAGQVQAPAGDRTALPFGSAAGRVQAPAGDRTALPFGSAAGRVQAPAAVGEQVRSSAGPTVADATPPPSAPVASGDPIAAPPTAAAAPSARVAALASAETTPTAERKPSRRHRATSAATSTLRGAQAIAAPVERTVLHPGPPASAAALTTPSIGGAEGNDAASAAPPPGGMTPSAVSRLYSMTARALDALSAAQAQDLREQFRHYNVQALMLAPQAERDDAAAQLARLLREAKRRKAP